jgi:hypothetical protein
MELELPCTDIDYEFVRGDANSDGNVDISDAVYIFQHLFAQGPAIPPPHPELGVDPTAEHPALPPCFYPRPFCEYPVGPDGCQDPP